MYGPPLELWRWHSSYSGLWWGTGELYFISQDCFLCRGKGFNNQQLQPFGRTEGKILLLWPGEVFSFYAASKLEINLLIIQSLNYSFSHRLHRQQPLSPPHNTESLGNGVIRGEGAEQSVKTEPFRGGVHSDRPDRRLLAKQDNPAARGRKPAPMLPGLPLPRARSDCVFTRWLRGWLNLYLIGSDLVVMEHSPRRLTHGPLSSERRKKYSGGIRSGKWIPMIGCANSQRRRSGPHLQGFTEWNQSYRLFCLCIRACVCVQPCLHKISLTSCYSCHSNTSSFGWLAAHYW